MSYVHFLDVFDPTGLPAGLSDSEAAERARNLRLTEPSPRLLALLTGIRQQPPGMTVNVLSVEWIDGDPPRVEGEGANCALWTLVLPVDEDFDTESLEDVVPSIAHWAQELGLRVFDEDADEWPNKHPGPDPVQEPPTPPGATSGTAVSIYLNHFIWAPYFSNQSRQSAQGLASIGEELMLMEEFPEPVLAKKSLAWRGRLVHRLMQQLPWRTHGEALWVNGDPEQRHLQWSGPGFEFQVPASRLDEVMRVLMPLARQLRAQVMVPARKFWFIDWNDVSPGAETLLRDWDAAWNTPPMEVEARRVRVLEHLKRRLEPVGFAFDDGPDVSFRFIRPLRLGGGYQMVEAGAHPFWLKLIITSERYFGIERLRGALLDNVSIRGYGARGRVVSQDIQNVCRYPFDTIAFQEDAAWFFDEFDRLFLPALEHLHTAKDIYEWYWDERWKGFNFNHRSSMHSVYAARYLPDAEFQVIVDEFMKKVPKGPMNEFARFMLTQPRFPDDLP